MLFEMSLIIIYIIAIKYDGTGYLCKLSNPPQYLVSQIIICTSKNPTRAIVELLLKIYRSNWGLEKHYLT